MYFIVIHSFKREFIHMFIQKWNMIVSLHFKWKYVLFLNCFPFIFEINYSQWKSFHLNSFIQSFFSLNIVFHSLHFDFSQILWNPFSSICEQSFLQMIIHNYLLSWMCFHWVQRRKETNLTVILWFFSIQSEVSQKEARNSRNIHSSC